VLALRQEEDLEDGLDKGRVEGQGDVYQAVLALLGISASQQSGCDSGSGSPQKAQKGIPGAEAAGNQKHGMHIKFLIQSHVIHVTKKTDPDDGR
jgi:hypothetical protein